MAAERSAITDAELICEWMESRPDYGLMYPDYERSRITENRLRSEGGWWKGYFDWTPPGTWNVVAVDLTLDRLHEVEARLSDEQKHRYVDLMCGGRSLGKMINLQQFDYADAFGFLSATAAQKIAALAQVIRAEAK